MNYHIWTIGCQMNTADSQRLASELEKLGYAWTEDPEGADVVVLNTCVVRQQVEDKIFGRLGSLKPVKAERPDTVIALMGCFVGHQPGKDLARRFPEVDVFIPPSETAPLVDFLRARAVDEAARELENANRMVRWEVQDGPVGVVLQDGPVDAVLRDGPSARRARRLSTGGTGVGAIHLPEHEQGRLISAHVPVSFGCNWVCTFCIIPSRRGPERSRPQDEIVAHVESLVAQGVREVTLLGQIVDRYGYDWGVTDGLPRLLERLNEIAGLARIRFLTSHPAFMSEELLLTVARLPKVMEHIEVPFQAGDDAVLARMKRGYTQAEYRELVGRIRDLVPNVAVHTDVIVGFCGETDAQFQATYDLMAELRLDKAHIAKFSTRPGTVAAKLLVDDVPPEEKEARRKALDELQQSICAEQNAAYVGRTVEVLVEDMDADKGRWRARTRTNKLVFFEDPRPLLGELVAVEVVWSGPWSMLGRTAYSPVPAVRAARELIPLAVG